MLCRALQVSRSGFYDWLEKPKSDRAREDERLLPLIRDSYAASGGVYGAPRAVAPIALLDIATERQRLSRWTLA